MQEPSTPSVSVVVPTCDRGALLARTVRSVLAQRGVALEVIVVDDGSADDTAATLAGFDDRRLTLLRHPRRQGVSVARNTGIAAASGGWVAFLDDDDLWAPDKLAGQVEAAERLGRAWACSGSVSFTETPRGGLRIVAGTPPPPAERIVERLPRRNAVPAGASNVLVRADALRTAGGFDPVLRHMADWDLWIRLARLGPPAVVPEPAVAYRLHTGNASRDSDVVDHEITYIEARLGAGVDRAFAHRWAAWNLLRAGRRLAAMSAYARALASGDLVSVGRAAVALVHPGIVHRTLTRHGADAAWIARAEAWLRALPA
ncbi:hypothetical protein tb265_15540 [Gemmatimonadetes bacterium T265]|nr:hypothetical protein tb265_15540 [Gemmatimonadetes bacterium T265]